MSKLRRMSFLGLAFLPLLVLAACGDDGDGGGPDIDTDYPPAGEDRFEESVATVEIEITLPGVGALPVALGAVETIELVGPTVVNRSDPGDTDGDGLADIQTEMVQLDLTGTSPTFGPVKVSLNPDRPSLGEVEQQERGQDTPAASFFDIFLIVEIVDLSLIGFNDAPIRMESELIEFPPGFRDQYEGALALPTPLLSAETEEEFARILDALHVPNPPPEDGEPPDGEASPEEGEPPSPEPAGGEITDDLLSEIVLRFLDEVAFAGYARDAELSGIVSNDDWIARALDVKHAPGVVEDFSRTSGYDVVLSSPTSTAYQIRISLSAFNDADGASGYLNNLMSYLQGAVGISSAHEGTLENVDGFTPGGSSGDGAVGATLQFGVPGSNQLRYHQTYLGIAEGQVRGSVSLFTTPSPTDEERNRAEDMIVILRGIIRDSLEQ